MLSRGPPKDRAYDGMSQLSQQQRRNLGDHDIKRIKSIQKYIKDNHISGIQSQMRIAMGLRAEGVLTDRVWYTLHTLIAGNAIGKDLKDPFKALQDPINQKKK